MNKKIVCAALAITLITTSCATDGNGPSNNQMAGTAGGALIGGIAGRLLGGNNKSMLLGAAIGAAAGAMFGTWLDDREKEQMQKASAVAAEGVPTGERIAWSSAPQPPAVIEAPADQVAVPSPAGNTIPTPKPVKAAASPPKPAPQAKATPAFPPPVQQQQASAPTQAPTASGWIIPTSDPYRTIDGRTCRDLRRVATKNGDTREQDVTACRSGAGAWDIPT